MEHENKPPLHPTTAVNLDLLSHGRVGMDSMDPWAIMNGVTMLPSVESQHLSFIDGAPHLQTAYGDIPLHPGMVLNVTIPDGTGDRTELPYYVDRDGGVSRLQRLGNGDFHLPEVVLGRMNDVLDAAAPITEAVHAPSKAVPNEKTLDSGWAANQYEARKQPGKLRKLAGAVMGLIGRKPRITQEEPGWNYADHGGTAKATTINAPRQANPIDVKTSRQENPSFPQAQYQSGQAEPEKSVRRPRHSRRGVAAFLGITTRPASKPTTGRHGDVNGPQARRPDMSQVGRRRAARQGRPVGSDGRRSPSTR